MTSFWVWRAVCDPVLVAIFLFPEQHEFRFQFNYFDELYFI